MNYWLVVSTHLKKSQSNWESCPNRGANKKYLNPPASLQGVLHPWLAGLISEPSTVINWDLSPFQ